jgi:anti-sigma regulatory factor (Ser/Thr protein kinase)
MPVSTAARPTEHPGYSETLPCVAESAEPARRLVRTALWAWGLGELADDGALVVTELVANAAQHTQGRLIRVAIDRPVAGTVRIGVVDRSHALPQPRMPDSDDERGRGLALVNSVAKRWGTDHLPFGKRVWGVLTCEVAE